MRKMLSSTLFRISIAVLLLVTSAPGEVSAAQQQDEVVLTLSTTTAAPGEPITVTVTNLTSSIIATFNSQSLCSIFTIQIQRGDVWENVLECSLDSLPTVPIAIPPGESGSLTFNGGPSFLDPGALEPGVYRVKFLYKRVEKIEDIVNEDIPWQTAFSPPFTIIPVIPQTTPASSGCKNPH